MSRIDQKLVELQLAPSRTKAQELLRAGHVEIYSSGQWTVVKTLSFSAEALTTDTLRLRNADILRYVSRGGLKLEGALKDFHMVVKDLKVLDVGISAGGFTDCLLEHGAKSVVGIDVGHGQLAQKLKLRPNVYAFERLHTKDLKDHRDFLTAADPLFDLLVMDVSFVSCLKVVPDVIPYLKPKGEMLILVKPQFELGEAALSKKGVVKDVGLYQALQVTIESGLEKFDFSVLGYKPSQLKGQDGNQEFFIHLRQNLR